MVLSHLSDAESKVIVTKILRKPEGRVDELGENFNKETGNKKNNQSKLKRKVTEKETTLEGISGRSEGPEWCSSRRMEDRVEGSTHAGHRQERTSHGTRTASVTSTRTSSPPTST